MDRGEITAHVLFHLEISYDLYILNYAGIPVAVGTNLFDINHRTNPFIFNTYEIESIYVILEEDLGNLSFGI